MNTLIPSFRANGWVIQPSPEGTWSFRSPLGSAWNPSPHELKSEPFRQTLLQENSRVQEALNTAQISPCFGTATLLQPPLPPEGAPLAVRIAKEHQAKGHAVLRLRTDPDEPGSQTLREHGAWRVDTLLPPWESLTHNPSNASTRFSIILCEHLIDTLPSPDRKQLYNKIQSLTPSLGLVFFNVFQMSALPKSWLNQPFEDGYLIPYGPHRCFVKPYNEAMLHREIAAALPGAREKSWSSYHELVCSWRSHA